MTVTTQDYSMGQAVCNKLILKKGSRMNYSTECFPKKKLSTLEKDVHSLTIAGGKAISIRRSWLHVFGGTSMQL